MNNKTLFRILFLSSFVASTYIYGCKQADDAYTCNDPIREWPFPGTASRWLFDPIKVGDVLKFKVYRRLNRMSRYIYLRDETFMISDTGIKKITQPNTYTAFNCNTQMISDYLTADIKGAEALTCQLANGAYTTLLISLQGVQYNVGDIQYLSHQFNWDDSLAIGGQTYYNVKNFTGTNDLGNGFYMDSTYCYYNLQYGILKFIINDTLIYLRNPH